MAASVVLCCGRTAPGDFASIHVVVAGEGSVESAPAGIRCPPQCDAGFAIGTRVVLTPALDPCYPMRGWSGDCSGSGPCEVVVDRDRRVRGEFQGPTGETLWSREFPIGYDVRWHAEGGPRGIAVDENGDVFVAGSFQGTLDFGGGPLTSDGTWNGFLSKLAGRDGGHLWSVRLGGSIDSYLGSSLGPLAALPGGDVAVAGEMYGTGDFGTTRISCGGLLVARCSGADGQPRWMRPWPAPSRCVPPIHRSVWWIRKRSRCYRPRRRVPRYLRRRRLSKYIASTAAKG